MINIRRSMAGMAGMAGMTGIQACSYLTGHGHKGVIARCTAPQVLLLLVLGLRILFLLLLLLLPQLLLLLLLSNVVIVQIKASSFCGPTRSTNKL